MTLRHIVSWKLNGETLDERNSQAERMRVVLEPLDGLVPQVRALSLHRNEMYEGSNYDLTLIVDFDDAEALEQYMVHPEHQSVVAEIKNFVSGRAVTDFTI